MQIYHEQSEFNRRLRFIRKYRYLLFAVSFIFVLFERYVNDGTKLVIIYTMVVILLGVIYQSKLILLIQSGLVTITSYLLAPMSVN
ncbi:hypothetical protein AOA60_20635, partial [Pseudomonas sp. 2822-17]